MLRPIPVVLAPYDPEWPREAARYIEELGVLGSVLVAAHHIGSTSVPGLAAKPIVDLMGLATRLAALDERRADVEALGYRWHGELGIAGRRYCTLDDAAGRRRAQLHFFVAVSPGATRHLAFRDYLRAHPDVAQAYEQEKRRARALHPDNSYDYADEKAAWIARVEAQALAWFAERCAWRAGEGIALPKSIRFGIHSQRVINPLLG